MAANVWFRKMSQVVKLSSNFWLKHRALFCGNVLLSHYSEDGNMRFWHVKCSALPRFLWLYDSHSPFRCQWWSLKGHRSVGIFLQLLSELWWQQSCQGQQKPRANRNINVQILQYICFLTVTWGMVLKDQVQSLQTRTVERPWLELTVLVVWDFV